MSLLGFNFSFGARDDGFASALGRAGQGLKGVSSQVDSLAQKVSSGNFLQAFQTLQLDQLSDQLSSMNSQSGSLETSLEGTFRSMAAEIRPMLAQLGLTGKEFDRASSSIVSTADALNVGATEVAESFRAIRRAGDQTREVFKKMGIGMKELTLIQKATGLSAEEVSGLVRNLTESYGFTTDETASFLDNFTNLTQGLGIADVAFGSLQDTMSTLDDTLASNTQFMAMSRDEQAKHVQDQVMGVQKLTSAFMGLGKTPKEAQSAAMEFFKTISKERTAVDGMKIGLGDMGELFHSLAEEAGFKNVENLFANISGDPTEALQQIVGMQDKLKQAGDPAALARFNSKLQEMMGGLSFIGEAGKGFSQRLAEINKSTGKTGDGLVGMAKKAHTANRGLDEVLSRMEDRFERNLLKLTGNTRTMFVQNQKEMYETVAEEAKKLGSKETFGPLFKQFVAARKIGAAAFFMPMQRDAKQTKKALENISDAVGEGGLMGRFKAIKSLGITGFFMDLEKPFKSNADRLADAEKKTKAYGAQLQALGLTAESIKPALLALGTAFAGLFLFVKSASAITTAVSGIGTVLSVLGGVLAKFAIGAKLMSLMTFIAGIAASPVVIGAAIVGALYALSKMPQEMVNKVSEAIDSFATVFDDIFDVIYNFDIAGLTNEVYDMLEAFVVDVFRGVASVIMNPSKFMPILKSIGMLVLKIGSVVGVGIMKISEFFRTLAFRILKSIGQVIVTALTGLYQLFDETVGRLGRYIFASFKKVVITPLYNLGVGIKDAFVSGFDAVVDFFMTNPITTAFKAYVIDPLNRFLDSIVDGFNNFFNEYILTGMTNALNSLIGVYNKINSFLPDALKLDDLEEVDFTIEKKSYSQHTALINGQPMERKIEVQLQSNEALKEQRKQTKLLEAVVNNGKKPNNQNTPGSSTNVSPAQRTVRTR